MNNNQEDLKTSTKQRDFIKGMLIGACILWLLILVAAIYFYSKKDNIALFVPAFSLIVVFLPVYLRFKSLDDKIKSKKIC